MGAFIRRSGAAGVKARVLNLIETSEAAWCAAVRLELWNGVGSERDRTMLDEFEQRIPELEIDDVIWEEACELAERSRKAGKTAPGMDVLIAACARHHHVEVEAEDAHFDFLMKL